MLAAMIVHSCTAAVLVAAAVAVGCGGPSETTAVRVGDIDFVPKATLYGQFDADVGGSVVTSAHSVRFARAIAFDAEVSCSDVDVANCDADVGADANRMILDIQIDPSLFGPARLGDYAFADGSSWQLLTPDGKTFAAESGKARLYQLDDDTMSADFAVAVGGVDVDGDIVGARCPALDKVLSGDC
jgi:hypothetical protein